MVNKRKDLMVIGIDPGQQGAIVVLSKKIIIHDMPLLIGRGVNGKKVYDILNGYKGDNPHVYIEKAQGMPNMGVTGVFHYGTGYGKLLMAIEMLDYSFEEIRPDKWKKAYGISGKGKNQEKLNVKQRKEKAVKVAMQLFPLYAKELTTERGRLLDGRAEALLIAEYGRRILIGGVSND